MLSIIIPVYNESESLRHLHDELHWACAYLPHGSPPPAGRGGEGGWGGIEFIYVDDGSTDASWSVLEELAARDPRIVAVRLRRNCGKATAYAAGVAHARGDCIATIDADLQDDPAELGKLLMSLRAPTLWSERSNPGHSVSVPTVRSAHDRDCFDRGLSRNDIGADLVVGYKHDRQDTMLKIASSRLFNAALRRVAGTTLHDHNSGFRVMTREVVESLPLHGDLHRVIPAVAAMHGFRIVEVPVSHRPRRFGESKYGRTGLSRTFRGLFDLMTVAFLYRFRARPLHFFGAIGLALLALGIAINTYLTAIWFGGASIGTRPLLLLGVLFMVLGIQVVSTGFVADLVMLGRAKEDALPIRQVVRSNA